MPGSGERCHRVHLAIRPRFWDRRADVECRLARVLVRSRDGHEPSRAERLALSRTIVHGTQGLLESSSAVCEHFSFNRLTRFELGSFGSLDDSGIGRHHFNKRENLNRRFTAQVCGWCKYKLRAVTGRIPSSRMAMRGGDYNFKGSALERGAPHEPRETEDGYASTFLDKTKIETPKPADDSATTLGNPEGAATQKGDYNFEGSALERGVEHQPRETEDGYASTFLDKTKIETPDPQGDSAITLGNTEGADIRKGDFNFEGSALERGVPHEPRQTEGGYASTYLDKTKIETPDPQGESAITLGNTEGADTRKGDYNFEGSDLDRGTDSSSFLDKTKIETPDPQGESATTLENTEGSDTRKGDYNFEGSDLDRGTDSSSFLDKTKIETPAPEGESAVTLSNST